MFVRHPVDAIFELVGRNTQWATCLGGSLGNFVQLVRNQACLEHAVPGHRNESGDINTHWAHERAASANRAAVVDQVLPFLHVFDRNLAFKAEQAIEESERPNITFVRAFEQFDLPDRGVLRIISAHVEMTSIGTHAAVQASIEVRGRLCIEILQEVPHRFIDAFIGVHVSLLVVTNLWWFIRQPFSFTIEFVSSVNGGHVLAPLRSNAIPVVPRVMNTRKTCPNLPKGSQIMKSTTERMWMASRSS